jgi:hypothetical protein
VLFFVREGCIDALMAMVENVSIHKAIVSVSTGQTSKSVVVRSVSAQMMNHVVTAIGAERFYGASKETQVGLAVSYKNILLAFQLF